jgi:hypothetical protein
MWNLWQTQQHFDRVFLLLLSFSPVSVVSVGKAVLLWITILALWIIASSIRYSNNLIYVFWPTPAWKNEILRFGDTICTRLPAKIKITTFSVGPHKSDRPGPEVEVGCKYRGLYLHMFTFLHRVLLVEISDSLMDGSSKVIDVHFTAFSLYMSWETVKNLHYKRCCICFGEREAVLLKVLINVRVDVVIRNMLWRHRGKSRNVI